MEKCFLGQIGSYATNLYDRKRSVVIFSYYDANQLIFISSNKYIYLFIMCLVYISLKISKNAIYVFKTACISNCLYTLIFTTVANRRVVFR